MSWSIEVFNNLDKRTSYTDYLTKRKAFSLALKALDSNAEYVFVYQMYEDGNWEKSYKIY